MNKQQKVTPKQFKRFLKSLPLAYPRYLMEMELNCRPSIKELTKKYAAKELLLGSFVWSESAMGHAYWSDINKAWEQHLNTIK